ncbi:hypothetical protein UFOVP1666_188 [uncultured Caudovirales phage]|uniref:Uncharacterized protein n=1 Tax=uncultured Caudovirales phage TaxID=2100421 RepID=A0A6J5PF56_9CAUD|nr:hypothetical protein UFOVP867_143 [uncultured Caudovirales phage]CAB4170570.1 hypothetical protein UFOVP913_55 [uncultured Caudovirales phage]CAB4176975.1 hypothetical protein UFOVP993_108 [uncultured Caudovirales phage]CAB4223377.1 hypothetical protein UFOVP1666_188 [uncultured Caudovirales phage]
MSTMIESLREQVGLNGAAAILANEILVLHDQKEQGQLTKEEYIFLMQDIALVRAQSELAGDEIASRYIIMAIVELLSMVP